MLLDLRALRMTVRKEVTGYHAILIFPGDIRVRVRDLCRATGLLRSTIHHRLERSSDPAYLLAESKRGRHIRPRHDWRRILDNVPKVTETAPVTNARAWGYL